MLDVIVGGTSTLFTLLKLVILAAILLALVTALQGCAVSSGPPKELVNPASIPVWHFPGDPGPAVLFRSDGAQLTPTTLSDCAEELASYDIVFAGEQHGTAASHALQADLLRQLHRLRKTKVSLSMEQFERDVQVTLSEYLAGMISKDDFLALSRPWPNYRDYQPMVEFAKGYGLPVLAANIPRRYASQVFRQGVASIEQLSHEERTWVAARVILEPGAYMDKFYQFAGREDINFYAAQAIKDDTMAESIVTHIDSFPDRLVFHTNGVFHSDSHLGTVERVAARRPLLDMAVTTTVRARWQPDGPSEQLEDAPEGASWLRVSGHGWYLVPDDVPGIAEFVLLVPAPPPRPVALPPGHGQSNQPSEQDSE